MNRKQQRKLDRVAKSIAFRKHVVAVGRALQDNHVFRALSLPEQKHATLKAAAASWKLLQKE